jgi:hypothetical protein
MKKQIFKMFALFGLLLVAGFFQAASAQTASRVVVNVPFSFVAGGESLPAGSYEISRLSVNSEKALLIRSLDGNKRAAVLTEASQAGSVFGVSQIAFRQYGDRYFLAEIRRAGTTGARGQHFTRAEKELRRERRRRVAQGVGAGEERRPIVITLSAL